jgi:hypothetical protein
MAASRDVRLEIIDAFINSIQAHGFKFLGDKFQLLKQIVPPLDFSDLLPYQVASNPSGENIDPDEEEEEIDSLNRSIILQEKEFLTRSGFPDFGLNALVPETLDQLQTIMYSDASVDLYGEDPDAAVFEAQLDGNPIIIKFSTDPTVDNLVFNSIVHEAFIGLFGLNRLQSPNFAKIIATSLSSCPSYIDHEICSYVAYEYIEGPTLSKFMESNSDGVIKSILYQVFEAIYYAYRELDFTHYDLHLDNIMIRNNIPVIIDYGRSHIKINNVNYGYYDLWHHVYNRSRWYYDILTLCKWIYLSERIQDEIKSLLEFFTFATVDANKELYYYGVNDIIYDFDIFVVSPEIIHRDNYDFDTFLVVARKILVPS